MRKSAHRFGTKGSLLVGSIALGVAWWSYSQSIDPFLEREKEARDAIASLKERVGRARTAIQDVRALESDAQTVRRQIEELGRSLPEGAATTWMPELLKQHFSAFGLNTSIVRMNVIRAEPDLPGFCRGYWSVGLPLGEASRSEAGSLLAVAELEQQYPFAKVLDFAVRPDPENPQGRIVLLNVAALVRK